jgi:ATP-dependent DNA helicase RecG
MHGGHTIDAKTLQRRVLDFPRQAVREALSSAALHRDFHPRGPIHLEYTPQIFSIESPGPLVAGVSPQNILRHRPQPRTPALVAAAHKLGLAEEIGTGIDRMYRSTLGIGKDLPQIVDQPDAGPYQSRRRGSGHAGGALRGPASRSGAR